MATWPTIVDDDGSNTTGTIVNNANVWTPIQSYVGGAWTAVAFNAGNFTANGSMTWTVESGDVENNRYLVIGKTLFWSLGIVTSTIGGTPNTELRATIPGGEVAAATGFYTRCAYAVNNGSVVEARAVVAAATYVALLRNDGANWSTGTNNNVIQFNIVLHIA